MSLPERHPHEELAREILCPIRNRLLVIMVEVNVKDDNGEDDGQCADHQDYRQVHSWQTDEKVTSEETLILICVIKRGRRTI